MKKRLFCLALLCAFAALLAANLNGDKDVNRKDLAILSKHLRNPELYPLS